MKASFEISHHSVEQIKKDASQNYSISPIFRTAVVDKKGDTVLEIEKVFM